MAVYKLELTVESAKSCREKPIALLSVILLKAAPGDIVELEGEDLYYPYRHVKEALQISGMEILEEDYDGFTYRIKAVKKGDI